MKHLIVIPAHNEETTIREVVVRSLKYADVSVTDDGSRDATPAILREIQAECDRGIHPHALHIITHDKATHIPRGIQDGLRYAAAEGYDYAITMDAGLSHDPNALPGFIAYDGSVDVVIGSRRETKNVPLYRRCISRCAARVVNYTLSRSYFDLKGPGLFDTTSGFRRYSRRAVELLAGASLVSRAFDFHMEALALCVRSGMRTGELPITYVFSNSSFNLKVLRLGIDFALHLLATKRARSGRVAMSAST